jgi:tetratricopeptide (TPR) repeat protein
MYNLFIFMYLESGTRFGPYEIVAPIGEGGMGRIFRARDTRLGRAVALKILSPEKLNNLERKRWLLKEARAVSALNHPNIVILYDIASHAGIDFLVLEYVEGKTLKELIPTNGLSFDEVSRYGAQIATGLAAAHRAGVVHGDMKSANIMITPEAQVKILDFGIARLEHAAGVSSQSETVTSLEETPAGRIIGTIAYMSPEQTRGEVLDWRTDIFSLGSVLYEAATGRLPFQGASALSLMHKIASEPAQAASSIRADLPPVFDLIIERALDKDKAQRYGSAAELADALDALRAPAATPFASVIEDEPAPVVGREQEIRRLEGLLELAVRGSGKIALLSGEPGIGKTALARLFLYSIYRRYPDLLVGRGACVEQYGTGEAYLPFLEALRTLLTGRRRDRLVAILRRHAPTWCLQFPSIFSGAALDQLRHEAIGASKERMLREFGDALREIAAEFPIVLLLEDLHWSDSSSIDLIRHLGQHIREQRLLVLGTVRPEEQEAGYQLFKNCKRELQGQLACEEIQLAALEPEHIARYLARHFSPNDFPPDFAAMIHHKTEGHPLFTTGIFQLLVERGDAVKRDQVWRLARPLSEMDLAVPESVRGMIAKKLEMLEKEDRRVLQYASVQGDQFLSAVLVPMLKIDELALEECLARLERVHSLIQTLGEDELPDGSLAIRYRFAHVLYQNHLYTNLLSKRRTLLHREAGEILVQCYGRETARIAMALARHFERGRDLPRAVQYLIQAGDNAVALYAHAQAIEHYSRALELTEKLAEVPPWETRTALYKKRGDALLSIGCAMEAATDFQKLCDLAHAAGHAEWECRGLILLANVHNYKRDPESMEHSATQALAMASSIEHRELRAEAVGQVAMSRMVIGRLVEAHELFEQSISAARPLRHVPALLQSLTFSGVNHFFRSRYADAESAEIEASRIAAESDNGFYLALSLMYLGFSRANLGRLSEALATLNEALEIARRNGNQIVLARAPNAIGWIYREIGNLQDAIGYNEACVETARQARAQEAESNALINLIYDYMLTGQSARALDTMGQVETLFDRELWNRWRFFDIRNQAAAAEYWLATGKLDRAEEHGQRLLANAVRYGVPKYLATAHRILGEIASARGDANAAEEALARSLEPFTTNPAPLGEWKNHAAFGRVLLLSRRPAAAHESFRRAADVVQRISGNITDSELRSGFLRQPAVRQIFMEASV